MGNKPSEYYGVSCSVCGKRLRACKAWTDIELKTINRTVDEVRAYEFHRGEYYRIRGYNPYYCANDFWQPERLYLSIKNKKEGGRKKLKGCGKPN